MFKKWLNKLASKSSGDVPLEVKPHQSVRVKVGTFPNTFGLRIDHVDQQNIYIAGLTLEELNYAVMLPQEKIEMILMSDNFYYKTEAVLKEKRNHPIYLWVLSRPKTMRRFKERRKTFRLDNVVETKFIADSDLAKLEKEALTRNISITGVAIVSEENLSLHSRFDLKLTGFGTLKGQVMWKYQRPDFDKWYYGVEFVGLTDAQQNALSRYINEKLGRLKWAGFI